MTESDYMIAADLRTVRIVRAALSDSTLVANGEVNLVEYSAIMGSLCRMEEKLASIVERSRAATETNLQNNQPKGTQ